MSDHYEVVFTCLLRVDMPESALQALRWHLGMEAPEPADNDEDAYPLLGPDTDSPLPGGDFASLQRHSLGFTDAWGLFSRNHWLDDDLGQVTAVLDLLAPYVAEEGYGGHFREMDATTLTAFVFREGTYELKRRS